MYDHVLVGTDGSTPATAAVEAAARLAQSHQARLTIAHAYRAGRVVSVRRPDADPNDHPQLWTARGAAAAVVAAATARAQSVACGGLPIDGRAEPGHPTSVLVALARELCPDAIVIGDHEPDRALGRRRLRHALYRQTRAHIYVIPTPDRPVSRFGRQVA